MTASRRRWSFSLRTMFVWLTLACVGVAWLFIPFRDMGKSVQEFPRRHSEARNAIESVYAFYDEAGRWPDESDMAARNQSWLPPDWRYSDPANRSAPSIALHGSYHQLLYYIFEPPQQQGATRAWTRSWEGDHTYFQSDEPYSVGGVKVRVSGPSVP